MTAPPPIRALDAPSIAAVRPQLGALLADSVRHGASVGFLAPLDAADADAYWQRVEHAVAGSRCVLLVWNAPGGPWPARSSSTSTRCPTSRTARR
jgi:hypothetical protein